MALDDEVDDESVLTIEKYREDEHGQPLTKDGASSQMDGGSSSFLSTEEIYSSGLSQFIFLNPRWLVAAVAYVLRHSFTWKIHEIKREVRKKSKCSTIFSDFNKGRREKCQRR
mmetsp:Transcript_37695/g.55135  ORF Transcript_37695/g.55135 Transcript_37695/m.55135 type:complete len:113 (+) Transcript_37695:404-742(+)